MHRFSVLTTILPLSVAAGIVLLVGCSGGTSTTPNAPSRQGHVHPLMGHVPAAVDPISALKINTNTGRHFSGFNNCPPSGPITYISDYNNSVINIYSGAFAGQGPCGQLVSGLVNPEGLFVRMPSRRLYVANTGALNVVVFDRGGIVPIKTYFDPSDEFPADVAVASDGTVIASNMNQVTGAPGSISTWHTNGVFVGNFKMVHDIFGLFLTVQTGTAVRIYYNDMDNSGIGVVYTGKCPAGHCGAFTATPATTNTIFPGGLRSRNADTRLIQFDEAGGIGGARLRYNDLNPLFPPSTPCNINGGTPIGFDMNMSASTMYYADAGLNVGTQMTFFCGSPSTVPGNSGGLPVGAAHDPPEPL